MAIGVFRLYYQTSSDNKITILDIRPALKDDEIAETKDFDPESKMCAEFLEKFPTQCQ